MVRIEPKVADFEYFMALLSGQSAPASRHDNGRNTAERSLSIGKADAVSGTERRIQPSHREKH